jgi:hypothetical protein
LTVAYGVGVFLLLSLISVLAGLGILDLLRIQLAKQAELALAPCVTLAFWSLCLGVIGGLRLGPLKDVSIAVWIATLLLAAIGLIRRGARLRVSWPLVVALVCSALAMAAYVLHGLTDYDRAIALDGWSYVAYGHYLWDASRGVSAGLSPLDQYGAHLSGTRFVAPALLAFISPLVGAGDTAAAKGLLQAWTLFVYGCGVAFLWLTLAWPAAMVSAAVVLSVVSGWTADLVWTNNLDNGLVLAYPAMLAGCVRSLSEGRPIRIWILVALFVASLAYTYPEFTPQVLVTAFLIALPLLWRQRDAWKIWAMGIVGAVSVALVLVLPFLGDVVAFAIAQLQISTAAARPGADFFPGMLDGKFEPAAFWGLGGELQVIAPHQRTYALLLSLLALIGAFRLVRKGEWGIVSAAALLCAGAVYYLVWQHYPYAAYKFVLAAWFLLAAMLVVATRWLTDLIQHTTIRQAALGLAGLGAALLAVTSNHSEDAITTGPFKSPYRDYTLSQFASVQGISQVTDGQPVLLLVDDWLAQEWAVYYLRDSPIGVMSYRMSMAQSHVLPFMARAQPVDIQNAHYLLTDEGYAAAVTNQPGWTEVWSNGLFRLWSSAEPDWAFIADITNANGLELVDGRPFFWVGGGDSVVDVVANRNEDVDLSATFRPGPSVASKSTRTISVSTSSGFTGEFEIQPGDGVITVPVQSGHTNIVLRALDQPNVATLPNGDPRSLVLGVQGLTLQVDNPQATTSAPVESTITPE